MKIVRTFEQIPTTTEPSIFLAGPVDRNGIDRWRDSALDYLRTMSFAGIVFVPEFEKRITKHDRSSADFYYWEREALEKATVVLFWVPRTKAMPGLTTNIEFGEWSISHPSKVILAFPKNALSMDSLEVRARERDIPIFNNLQQALSCALKNVKMEN